MGAACALRAAATTELVTAAWSKLVPGGTSSVGRGTSMESGDNPSSAPAEGSSATRNDEVSWAASAADGIPPADTAADRRVLHVLDATAGTGRGNNVLSARDRCETNSRATSVAFRR